MTSDHETWRARGLAMAKLLSTDLPDEDWHDALRVLAHVAIAAKVPAAAVIAKRASGAGGNAPVGLAVRRDACRHLITALSAKPARRFAA